jgi:hypothetical protein
MGDSEGEMETGGAREMQEAVVCGRGRGKEV